ncbi:hypothetical protein [Aurantibacillus circumpalustris]|uniref:hypothetical protein n=1 Tax=Aurantibacillus circumpalustris TaxID=3036359 RepID=UPI00295AC11E|nr:hypothetical protein [Aurantibacillus circumpalustris]
MNKHEITFKQYKCILKKLKYRNDRIAIELVNAKNGEPVLTATVNIPDEALGADEVIIKNYSENEGVLRVLINASIISFPIRYANDNDGMPVCKLLI